MSELIRCSQFVISKFTGRGDQSVDDDFEVVAHTPDLSPSMMEELRKNIKIGDIADLSDLDSFFLKDIPVDNSKLLAHFIKSPVKAGNRPHFIFSHYIIIKGDDWRKISRDIESIVNINISSNVYVEYHRPKGSRRPIVINYLDINIKEKSDLDLVSNFQYFIQYYKGQLLKILHGVLQYDSIIIRNLPDNIQKPNLINVILSLLPNNLSDRISFCTQVFDPRHCHVKMKFMENLLSNSGYEPNQIIDWPKDNKWEPQGYSSTINDLYESGEHKDILPRIKNIDSNNLLRKKVNNYESNFSGMSNDLAISVDALRGIRSYRRRSIRKSIPEKLKLLHAFTNEQIDLDLEDFIQSTVDLVLDAINNKSSLMIDIVKFICLKKNLLGKRFWQLLNDSIVNDKTPPQNLLIFLKYGWDHESCFVSQEIPVIMVRNSLRNLPNGNSIDIIATVDEWIERNALIGENIIEIYTRMFFLSKNISYIRNMIISCDYNVYTQLVRVKILPLPDHPNLDSLIRSLTSRVNVPASTFSGLLLEMDGDFNLFIKILEDYISILKEKSLNLDILYFFLDENIFDSNQIIIIKDLLKKYWNYMNDINKGFSYYIISLHKRHFSEDLSLYTINNHIFVHGFLLASFRKNNIPESIKYITTSIKATDVIKHIYSLSRMIENSEHALYISTIINEIGYLYTVISNHNEININTSRYFISRLNSLENSEIIKNNILSSHFKITLLSYINKSNDHLIEDIVKLIFTFAQDVRLENISQSIINIVNSEKVSYVDFIEKFRLVLAQLEYHNVDILSFALDIGASDLWGRVSKESVEYYTKSLLNRAVRPSLYKEYAKRTLKDYEYSSFFALLDFWLVPEESFESLILSSWRPRDINDYNHLMDGLNLKNLRLYQIIIDKMILSSRLSVPHTIKIAILNDVLLQIHSNLIMIMNINPPLFSGRSSDIDSNLKTILDDLNIIAIQDEGKLLKYRLNIIFKELGFNPQSDQGDRKPSWIKKIFKSD